MKILASVSVLIVATTACSGSDLSGNGGKVGTGDVGGDSSTAGLGGTPQGNSGRDGSSGKPSSGGSGGADAGGVDGAGGTNDPGSGASGSTRANTGGTGGGTSAGAAGSTNVYAGSGGSIGSGGSHGDGSRRVDCGFLNDRPLRTLATGSYAAVCDCVAAAAGGYGTVISCDGAPSYRINVSQADCVSKMKSFAWHPECTATVATAMQCLADLASCADPETAACAQYGACF